MDTDTFIALTEPGADYDVVARLVEVGQRFGIEREVICEERRLALYHFYRSAEQQLRWHDAEVEPLGVFIAASDVQKLVGVDPELSWDRTGGIQSAASRGVFRQAMEWLEELLARAAVSCGPRQRLSDLAERALITTA